MLYSYTLSTERLFKTIGLDYTTEMQKSNPCPRIGQRYKYHNMNLDHPIIFICEIICIEDKSTIVKIIQKNTANIRAFSSDMCIGVGIGLLVSIYEPDILTQDLNVSLNGKLLFTYLQGQDKP